MRCLSLGLHLCRMYSMAKTFDERELSPIFEPTDSVIRAVLGREPEADLIDRIEARRGRRISDGATIRATRRKTQDNPLILGSWALRFSASVPTVEVDLMRGLLCTQLQLSVLPEPSSWP